MAKIESKLIILGDMPAWGGRLSDEQINSLVSYIRAWEPTAPAVASPGRGGGGQGQGGGRGQDGPAWRNTPQDQGGWWSW